MATITIRRLDPVTWDPSYGHGADDLISDLAAVTQLIQQHFRFFYAEWWEDRTLGVPWFGPILGGHGQGAYAVAVSDLVRSHLLKVPFVTSVANVQLLSVSANRTAAFSYTAITPFGAVTGSFNATPAAIINE